MAKPAFPKPAAVLPGEAGVLATVLADLSDHDAKLVYADWLQDRGEERRAEYLRVLCRWLACHPATDRELIERERELRAGLGRWWLARVRGIRVREKRGREKAD